MFSKEALKVCEEYTEADDEVISGVKELFKRQTRHILTMVENYPIATLDEPVDLEQETRWIEEALNRQKYILGLLHRLQPLV